MKAACKVVGMKAGGREHVVAQVSEGDPVLLVPEPDNPYDPHALAVYTAPRTVLEPSSRRRDDGTWDLCESDRRLVMDRQAGYVPRDVAARVRVGPDGLDGVVHEVRWHPAGHPAAGTPAGFDVLADFPRRGR